MQELSAHKTKSEALIEYVWKTNMDMKDDKDCKELDRNNVLYSFNVSEKRGADI